MFRSEINQFSVQSELDQYEGGDEPENKIISSSRQTEIRKSKSTQLTTTNDSKKMKTNPINAIKKKLSKNIVKSDNIKRFRFENPDFKRVGSDQIMSIFKLYREMLDRTYEPHNISLLVSGTLIILISSFFMNGGAERSISNLRER